MITKLICAVSSSLKCLTRTRRISFGLVVLRMVSVYNRSTVKFKLVVLSFILMLPALLPCYSAEEKRLDSVQSERLSVGKIGMVAYMLEGKKKSEKDWLAALTGMKELGVQVVEVGQLSWVDLEPEEGKYNWTYAEKVLRINKEKNLGFSIVADIGMFINPGLNGKPKLPGYLKKLDFDDPRVIKALSNLYIEFLKLEGADNVHYLFQHFENADASFKGKEENRAKVKKLLVESFKAAKKVRPDLKTGVCIEDYKGDDHWPERQMDEWNHDIGCDVIPIISFSPTNFKKSAREELNAILKYAKGKPVALNEFWLHSSKKADSSPEQQSEFIKESFSLLKDHYKDIEFVTWYEYKDLDWFTAKFIGAYLSFVCLNPFSASHFEHRMGSCGLFSNDGKPKPAAKTWIDEVKKYYQFRKQAQKPAI